MANDEMQTISSVFHNRLNKNMNWMQMLLYNTLHLVKIEDFAIKI